MGSAAEIKEMLVELSPTMYVRKRSKHEEETFQDIKGKDRRVPEVEQTANYLGLEDTDADVLLEEDLHLDQFGLVAVKLLADQLVWQRVDTEDKMEIGILCCLGSKAITGTIQLAISEIYAVESLSMGGIQHSKPPIPLCCLTGIDSQEEQMHRFMVHSFQRSSSSKGTWIPNSHIFGHPNLDVCQKWVHEIGYLLEQDIKRPRNLLVIMSPYSGKKMAAKTWEKVIPLFNRAGVTTQVFKTERARHAFDIMEKATDEELQAFDGVIVVGGDGLFNEVLNGFLLRRHKAKCPPRPQEVAASSTTDFIDKLKDHDIHLNKRQNDLLMTYAETDAELVSLPAPGNLHPFLEDPSDQVSESSNFFKSSLASGNGLTFGSKASIFQTVTVSDTDEKITAVKASEHVISYPVRYKEGGFIVSSAAGAWLNAGTNTKMRTDSGSNSRLQLPNPYFRLGIIPAGSTDSIAVSTTGSRDPVTSALHIILGDNIAVDVVRLTGWKAKSASIEEEARIRYAVTFAGYGFYGDVIKESELYRWMGPLRYDFAGTKVFMKHRSYEAEVAYLEVPENMNPLDFVDIDMNSQKKQAQTREKKSCCVNCSVCARGFDYSDLDEKPVSVHPLSNSPRWHSLRGRFLSIGAAVVSCRNDKAPDGVAVHAHLGDGLLDLILIKDCSRPAYLWHLVNLTRKGGNALDFGFIEHHKTPVFTFTSFGQESIWNVDGELFPAHQLSAQVFRGLINMFARGPEA